MIRWFHPGASVRWLAALLVLVLLWQSGAVLAEDAAASGESSSITQLTDDGGDLAVAIAASPSHRSWSEADVPVPHVAPIILGFQAFQRTTSRRC